MKLSKNKKRKLSKNKKIILLWSTILIGAISIVTPIIVINDNKKAKEKEENIQYVKKIIKIIEEKSDSERKIELANNSKGKIIADNKAKIIEKIKELIGKSNLKGVAIEVSIKEDKEISITFEKIIVKISKGSYSQVVNQDKIISVRRFRKRVELSETISNSDEIDIILVENSLKNLKVKTLEVYIPDEWDKKITNNKGQILNEIKKIKGYLDIDFNGVNVQVKDSEKFLPSNEEAPVLITLFLFKNHFATELKIFSAKQKSIQEMAKIEIDIFKTFLEGLNRKLIKITTRPTRHSFDQKIAAHKDKILQEIKRSNLNDYLSESSITYLRGIKIEIENSQQVIPTSRQTPLPIVLVLSKNGVSNKVKGFSVKSLSTQEFYNNHQLFDNIRNSLGSLSTKIVNIYTNDSVDLKITTNKDKILKAIKKLDGYSDIDFKEAYIQVKDSNALLPANDERPIQITLIISKQGVSDEIIVFKAKQMSLQEMAQDDVNTVKNFLNSRIKLIEIDTFDSIDQKINTNKNKILKTIRTYTNLSNNQKGVTIQVKNSDAVLPANDETPIEITLIFSKQGAISKEIRIYVKQQIAVTIKNKIIDKEILISPNVPTTTKDEVQNAIRNQLKIANPLLNSWELLEIRTNVPSIELNTRKSVDLEISSLWGLEIKVISIHVTKASS